MTGAVYDFDLKQGSYVNPGDSIAKLGVSIGSALRSTWTSRISVEYAKAGSW